MNGDVFWRMRLSMLVSAALAVRVSLAGCGDSDVAGAGAKAPECLHRSLHSAGSPETFAR